MKKASYVLLITLVAATLSAVAQNQVDQQGRRQGHWVRIDNNGAKIFEGDFIDGLETGVFNYYYPDGTLRIRNTYTVDGRECDHEAYDEQGRLLAKGHYNQRNRHGRWLFYATDGALIKEATYNMGIKEGLHVIYTHSGDTAEVTWWENNHRHGRWWRRIGDRGYITANYVHGNLEGRLVQYDDNGLLVEEGHYVDGLRHGAYNRYEQGHLAVKERWTHGMMNDRQVLLVAPDSQYVSIHDMLCLAALGKGKVAVYLKDGSRLTALEPSDIVYNRLGNELLTLANRKSRIMVCRQCVQGVGKDNEGRDILLLEPQPDLVIFPDEDGIKMARSRHYDDHPLLQPDED